VFGEAGSFALHVDAVTGGACPGREAAARRVPAVAGGGCKRTRGAGLKLRDGSAFAPASADRVSAATRAGIDEARAVAATSLGTDGSPAAARLWSALSVRWPAAHMDKGTSTPSVFTSIRQVATSRTTPTDAIVARPSSMGRWPATTHVRTY